MVYILQSFSRKSQFSQRTAPEKTSRPGVKKISKEIKEMEISELDDIELEDSE